MTVSVETKNARIAAKKAVEQARESINAARNRATDARESGFYSDVGTREYVGGWVEDARKTSTAAPERVTRQAREARQAAEKALQGARTVPESQRNTAAAILAPVIAAECSDPEVLVSAYTKRAPQSLTDRVILEDAIGAGLDAGLGGVMFAENWNRVRNSLADEVYTDAERDAAEDLAAIGRLEKYLAGARTVVESDLEQIESGGGARYTAPIVEPEDIRRQRLELGATQQHLATFSGVSRGTICRIEGGGNYEPETLQYISAGLEALRNARIVSQRVFTVCNRNLINA